MRTSKIKGLYVILDPSFLKGMSEVEAAEAIIRGGARIIQWRDKTRDKGDQLPIVREINRLCTEAGVVSIVNDHVDLALVSTATVEEALLAEEEGASYIAVGAVYPTNSKAVTRPAGLETLEAVTRAVSAPVVAIGGISAGNVGPVMEAGADSACVISAVLSAADMEATARELSIAIEISSRG